MLLADDYSGMLHSLRPRILTIHMLGIYNTLESIRAVNYVLASCKGVGIRHWHGAHIRKMLQVVCTLF